MPLSLFKFDLSDSHVTNGNVMTAYRFMFIMLLVPWAVTSHAAAERRLPSVASIETGVDSEGGVDYFADLDLAVIAGHRLVATAGRSHSPSDLADIDTWSLLLGVESNPLRTISGGLEYAYWGDAGELTVDALRASLAYNAPDWRLKVSPQYRAITLETTGTTPRRRSDFDVDSMGLALAIRYHGIRHWFFSAGYRIYGYSRDVGALTNNRRAIFIFSPATLELASSFEDSRLSLGAGHAFASSTLSIEWLRSRSAVDNEVINIASLLGSLDVSRDITLRLRIGGQENPVDSDIIIFSDLAVSYRW